MTSESAPTWVASADSRSEVESKNLVGGEGQGAEALTVKQRKRWSPLTVDGILARPANTAQAHDLAMSLGKVMRGDGTFEPLRHADDMLCVEVRPSHRDRVRRLLELSPWSWGEYVRRWEGAGLAHKCVGLGRGSVRLFLDPAAVCPVPKCGALLGATVKRCSEQQSPVAESNGKPCSRRGMHQGMTRGMRLFRFRRLKFRRSPMFHKALSKSRRASSESETLALRTGISPRCSIGRRSSSRHTASFIGPATPSGCLSGRRPMPREGARAHAVRLLAERRVMIVRVLQTSALAYVRGDSGGLREVSWDPRRGWRCSCPPIGFCAHGRAVERGRRSPPASTAELLRDAASSKSESDLGRTGDVDVPIGSRSKSSPPPLRAGSRCVRPRSRSCCYPWCTGR